MRFDVDQFNPSRCKIERYGGISGLVIFGLTNVDFSKMESQNIALVSAKYVEGVTKLPECLCMRPKDMNLVKVKAVNFDIREIVKILLPPSTLSSFGSCIGLICCSLCINHSINKLSFTQIDMWNIIMIFQFKMFLCVVIFPVL